MTKADLVAKLASRVNLTLRDSEVVVDTIFDTIAQNLETAEKPGVEIRGFGSFRVRQRRARQGRNPQSGAAVDIPAKRVPFFKPGKELKALIDVADESPAEGASSPEPAAQAPAGNS
jgi:integration host factor subunit beta